MEKYILIGKTLGHSFSRGFFTAKFAAEGIDACYLNCEMPDVSGLRRMIEEDTEISGLNVTIPFKKDVIALMDDLSPEARAIGAVNVIEVLHKPGGKVFLRGHNTDVIGFGMMLDSFASGVDSSALVLGTGGAAQAVYAALDSRNIGWTAVSRSQHPGSLTYADLNKDIIQSNTLIINTTPLGTYPDTDTCPDIPYDCIDGRHACIDLVYNPPVTRFMAESAAHGACVRNGLTMLHSQALAAYKIWTKQQ